MNGVGGDATTLMTDEASSHRHYIKDHLGSIRVVVDATGKVVETRDYYPFGLPLPQRYDKEGTREDFTGHEKDGATGLHYAGARYYMAAYGRWSSRDPLADEYPSLSPYNYAANNPLLYIDPDGRKIILGNWLDRFLESTLGIKTSNLKRLEQPLLA